MLQKVQRLQVTSKVIKKPVTNWRVAWILCETRSRSYINQGEKKILAKCQSLKEIFCSRELNATCTKWNKAKLIECVVCPNGFFLSSLLSEIFLCYLFHNITRLILVCSTLASFEDPVYQSISLFRYLMILNSTKNVWPKCLQIHTLVGCVWGCESSWILRSLEIECLRERLIDVLAKSEEEQSIISNEQLD